ncbi:E3 ubiquitin-protein ligase SINA-like 3 [Brachypodium distachyon]|uniref:E3 ubiquitin-protein ligase SINA-like 3 n=1 Tax=Brachypodium distachyon TaxID=15368 RepID=UPI00052FFC81|nr:E3 ubiquitin-protein ligase SINA-like 3 [Brachypodium distachyon]|eukprot:XP_024315648.1 E3 ubiquitin-protein ligase SINA-like 3 [Brachypodium distachyon]
MQCAVGHAICSSCHGSLPSKDRCHACSAGGGSNRCNALEKILESFRVPCPNAAFGCAAATSYHEAENHRGSCPHAPCFCPEPGCEAFAGDHGWPSTEMTMYGGGERLTLPVPEGTTTTRVLHHGGGGEGRPLFLVRFTTAPQFGTVVPVVCVDPHAVPGERKFRCHLVSGFPAMAWHQVSDFQVRSTNLSGGMPPPYGSCVLVAPEAGSITVSIAKIMRDTRGNEIQLKRMRQSLLPFAIAS